MVHVPTSHVFDYVLTWVIALRFQCVCVCLYQKTSWLKIRRIRLTSLSFWRCEKMAELRDLSESFLKLSGFFQYFDASIKKTSALCQTQPAPIHLKMRKRNSRKYQLFLPLSFIAISKTSTHHQARVVHKDHRFLVDKFHQSLQCLSTVRLATLHDPSLVILSFPIFA